MKTMKLFAVSLIAAAVSVSALADHMKVEHTMVVETELEDLIEMDFMGSPDVNLEYRDLEGKMGDIVGSAKMVVKMRHADMNPRPYDLTINQQYKGKGEFVLKSENNDKITMLVSYYDEAKGDGQDYGHYQKPGMAKEYKTSNGMKGTKETELFFVITEDSHQFAPAGKYSNNLTVTLAAK